MSYFASSGEDPDHASGPECPRCEEPCYECGKGLQDRPESALTPAGGPHSQEAKKSADRGSQRAIPPRQEDA